MNTAQVAGAVHGRVAWLAACSPELVWLPGGACWLAGGCFGPQAVPGMAGMHAACWADTGIRPRVCMPPLRIHVHLYALFHQIGHVGWVKCACLVNLSCHRH